MTKNYSATDVTHTQFYFQQNKELYNVPTLMFSKFLKKKANKILKQNYIKQIRNSYSIL